MNDAATDPPAQFRKINVDGAARLARAAAESGVKRVIFISSIKVNGEVPRLVRRLRPMIRQPQLVHTVCQSARLKIFCLKSNGRQGWK
jgi:nucleoside-diphosphate-sugar epimerase